MKKIGEDFRNQAEKLGITKWPSHNCSFCTYGVGFIFTPISVYYDNGCNCSSYGPSPYRESSWDEVAERYNMQDNENTIKEMDKFWGFDNETKS